MLYQDDFNLISLAEWFGHRTCNLVVPGSSPPPCHPLNLFLVALSSTSWLHCVNSKLVCLLPVEIFKHFMFIWNFLTFVCDKY